MCVTLVPIAYTRNFPIRSVRIDPTRVYSHGPNFTWVMGMVRGSVKKFAYFATGVARRVLTAVNSTGIIDPIATHKPTGENKMFTKSICAPTGCGVGVFVAHMLAESGAPVVIVTHLSELGKQWQAYVPGAKVVSPHKVENCEGILIALNPLRFCRKEVARINTFHCDAWAIGDPLDKVLQMAAAAHQ